MPALRASFRLNYVVFLSQSNFAPMTECLDRRGFRHKGVLASRRPYPRSDGGLSDPAHGKSAGAPESDRFVEAEEVEEGAEPVLQPWAFSEGLAAWGSAKGGLA
jgi:hypothetical protein